VNREPFKGLALVNSHFVCLKEEVRKDVEPNNCKEKSVGNHTLKF
jgi:hypothetical protein